MLRWFVGSLLGWFVGTLVRGFVDFTGFLNTPLVAVDLTGFVGFTGFVDFTMERNLTNYGQNVIYPKPLGVE